MLSMLASEKRGELSSMEDTDDQGMFLVRKWKFCVASQYYLKDYIRLQLMRVYGDMGATAFIGQPGGTTQLAYYTALTQLRTRRSFTGEISARPCPVFPHQRFIPRVFFFFFPAFLCNYSFGFFLTF